MSQQKKPQSDISNISDLTKKYKKADLEQKLLEQKALNSAQNTTIQKMHEALAAKDEEIKYLLNIVERMPVEPTGVVERIVPSDEEVIVEMQLQKIRDKARISELTLEEARKFEIYTKYKQNKKDNSIPVTSRKITSEETTKLLSVASTLIDKDKRHQDE